MKKESFATSMMIDIDENGNILDKNVTSLIRHQSETQSNEEGSPMFLILGLITIGAIFLALFGVYRYRKTQNRQHLSSISFSGEDDCQTNMEEEEESVFKTSRGNKWLYLVFESNWSKFRYNSIQRNTKEIQSLAASSTLRPPAIRTSVPSTDDRKPRFTGLESSV